MLILDKQKAVERVVALTSGDTASAPLYALHEAPAAPAHGRTYHRIATYERRAAVAIPLRRVERRRRRMRPLDSSSPA